jgi:ABC-type glutathione transport system ATPase component
VGPPRKTRLASVDALQGTLESSAAASGWLRARSPPATATGQRLLDPPILILDEATSSVDNETEAAIQRSLERIAMGRTTIVVAHRLSMVRRADRSFVIDKGRLVEQGSHQELLEQRGLYAALWKVQPGEAQPTV